MVPATLSCALVHSHGFSWVGRLALVNRPDVFTALALVALAPGHVRPEFIGFRTATVGLRASRPLFVHGAIDCPKKADATDDDGAEVNEIDLVQLGLLVGSWWTRG